MVRITSSSRVVLDRDVKFDHRLCLAPFVQGRSFDKLGHDVWDDFTIVMQMCIAFD